MVYYLHLLHVGPITFPQRGEKETDWYDAYEQNTQTDSRIYSCDPPVAVFCVAVRFGGERYGGLGE